jgi:protein TonB
MSVLALHYHPDEGELRRYGAAAIAIVLLHVTLIAAALVWYERPEPQGLSIPAIMVDLAPAPAAQQIQTDDLAPGPQVQEAEAPPPEPPKTETVEEQLPPTPPQPSPVVAAPPKIERKPEPTPAKPQPVREKKPIKKRLVERSTTAKADRIAPDAPSPSAGASAAAAAASYRSILAAHLKRFKGWPSGAEARGEHGRVSINFTVSRNGRVTGARLTKSSGFASLDQEAMAWIQRAQPLPSFPAEIREATMNITAPLYWEKR